MAAIRSADFTVCNRKSWLRHYKIKAITSLFHEVNDIDLSVILMFFSTVKASILTWRHVVSVLKSPCEMTKMNIPNTTCHF
jgi:hypothetical protein